MTTTSVLIYVILGSLGLSYFMYGKAQRKIVALISGVGFSVAPYFTMNLWILVPLALLLIILPFFITV